MRLLGMKEALILQAILNGSKTSLTIMREVERLTSGLYVPGRTSVSPMCSRLIDLGLITSRYQNTGSYPPTVEYIIQQKGIGVMSQYQKIFVSQVDRV